jgi:hypothetical protein
MKIRKEQPFLEDVLFRNIGDFFVQLVLLAIEAINCLQTHQMGIAEKQAQGITELREHGIVVFEFEERVPRPK